MATNYINITLNDVGELVGTIAEPVRPANNATNRIIVDSSAFSSLYPAFINFRLANGVVTGKRPMTLDSFSPESSVWHYDIPASILEGAASATASSPMSVQITSERVAAVDSLQPAQFKGTVGITEALPTLTELPDPGTSVTGDWVQIITPLFEDPTTSTTYNFGDIVRFSGANWHVVAIIEIISAAEFFTLTVEAGIAMDTTEPIDDQRQLTTENKLAKLENQMIDLIQRGYGDHVVVSVLNAIRDDEITTSKGVADYVSGLASPLIFAGSWDPTTNLFPDEVDPARQPELGRSNILAKDFFLATDNQVNFGGFGFDITEGDTIVAVIDDPDDSTLADWIVLRIGSVLDSKADVAGDNITGAFRWNTLTEMLQNDTPQFNGDLDDLKTTGCGYSIVPVSASALNRPPGAVTGVVEIYSRYSAGVVQRFTETALQTISYRLWTGGFWTDWKKLADTEVTDTLDGRVTDNEDDIGDNTTDIETNATNIGNNATAIGINTTAIETNTEDIETNTTAIEDNAEGIDAKLSKSGGVMTGDIALETNRISFTSVPANSNIGIPGSSFQGDLNSLIFASTGVAWARTTGAINRPPDAGTGIIEIFTYSSARSLQRYNDTVFNQVYIREQNNAVFTDWDALNNAEALADHENRISQAEDDLTFVAEQVAGNTITKGNRISGEVYNSTTELVHASIPTTGPNTIAIVERNFYFGDTFNISERGEVVTFEAQTYVIATNSPTSTHFYLIANKGGALTAELTKPSVAEWLTKAVVLRFMEKDGLLHPFIAPTNDIYNTPQLAESSKEVREVGQFIGVVTVTFTTTTFTTGATTLRGEGRGFASIFRPLTSPDILRIPSYPEASFSYHDGLNLFISAPTQSFIGRDDGNWSVTPPAGPDFYGVQILFIAKPSDLLSGLTLGVLTPQGDFFTSMEDAKDGIANYSPVFGEFPPWSVPIATVIARQDVTSGDYLDPDVFYVTSELPLAVSSHFGVSPVSGGGGDTPVPSASISIKQDGTLVGPAAGIHTINFLRNLLAKSDVPLGTVTAELTIPVTTADLRSNEIAKKFQILFANNSANHPEGSVKGFLMNFFEDLAVDETAQLFIDSINDKMYLQTELANDWRDWLEMLVMRNVVANGTNLDTVIRNIDEYIINAGLRPAGTPVTASLVQTRVAPGQPGIREQTFIETNSGVVSSRTRNGTSYSAWTPLNPKDSGFWFFNSTQTVNMGAQELPLEFTNRTRVNNITLNPENTILTFTKTGSLEINASIGSREHMPDGVRIRVQHDSGSGFQDLYNDVVNANQGMMEVPYNFELSVNTNHQFQILIDLPGGVGTRDVSYHLKIKEIN